MDIRLNISVLLIAVALSACAKCGDPTTGGLIGGMQGAYGGCYDNRIEQKRNELEAQQRIGQQLERDKAALKEQYLAADSKLAVEQRELANLNKDIKSLEAQVAKLQTTPSMKKKDIALMKEKIEGVKKELLLQQTAIANLDQAGGSTVDPEEYQILLLERERLRKEYVALFEYSQALANATTN